jgi:hypothetical protein
VFCNGYRQMKFARYHVGTDDTTAGGPMTGPEHFRAAELLLAEAGAQPAQASARSIATAQVHATLALAAATALHGVTDQRHWFEAMGTPHADG